MKANWLERVVCYYNASYAHKREVYESSKNAAPYLSLIKNTQKHMPVFISSLMYYFERCVSSSCFHLFHCFLMCSIFGVFHVITWHTGASYCTHVCTYLIVSLVWNFEQTSEYGTSLNPRTVSKYNWVCLFVYFLLFLFVREKKFAWLAFDFHYIFGWTNLWIVLSLNLELLLVTRYYYVLCTLSPFRISWWGVCGCECECANLDG